MDVLDLDWIWICRSGFAATPAPGVAAGFRRRMAAAAVFSFQRFGCIHLAPVALHRMHSIVKSHPGPGVEAV